MKEANQQSRMPAKKSSSRPNNFGTFGPKSINVVPTNVGCGLDFAILRLWAIFYSPILLVGFIACRGSSQW